MEVRDVKRTEPGAYFGRAQVQSYGALWVNFAVAQGADSELHKVGLMHQAQVTAWSATATLQTFALVQLGDHGAGHRDPMH